MHIGSLATGTALPGRFDASLVVYSTGKHGNTIINDIVDFSTSPSILPHAKLNKARGQATKAEYVYTAALVRPYSLIPLSSASRAWVRGYSGPDCQQPRPQAGPPSFSMFLV